MSCLLVEFIAIDRASFYADAKTWHMYVYAATLWQTLLRALECKVAGTVPYRGYMTQRIIFFETSDYA